LPWATAAGFGHPVGAAKTVEHGGLVPDPLKRAIAYVLDG
jgi:hypothetical protein